MLNTTDMMDRSIHKGMRTETIYIRKPIMKGKSSRVWGKIYDGNVIRKDFVLWT